MEMKIENPKEVAVDIVTRRKKQQALLARALERRVRERAQRLYEERGQVDGRALEDWVRAESEILEKSPLASLYHRVRTGDQDSQIPGAAENSVAASDLLVADSSPSPHTSL